MGQPDQFAKRTFAEDTPLVTRGAVTWEDPPETRLVKVQGDGVFLVRDPTTLADLAAPWPDARTHAEILVELKMPGDHMDIAAIQRALLRRQGRQVERVEATEPPWEGEEPLWLVAPHLPALLPRVREVRSFAPGCYRVGPSAFSFLWIAANELPMCEELIPFLVARSGRALDEFGRWVVSRRPVAWVLDMVQYTAMSTSVRDELLRNFTKADDPEVQARQRHMAQVLLEAYPDVVAKVRDELLGNFTKADDPEVQARQRHMAQVLLEAYPDVAAKVRDEGRTEARTEGQLSEARTMLRRVLARRKLAVSAEEDARIETCTDLATLEHWIEEAAVATSTGEALG